MSWLPMVAPAVSRPQPRYAQHDFNLYMVTFLAIGFILGFFAFRMAYQPDKISALNDVGALYLYCDGQLPCDALDKAAQARVEKQWKAGEGRQ